MSDPLSVLSLSHDYGHTPVLRDVSLDVAPGELVAVLGASGSGKTTLLRALAGFVTPSLGDILIQGRAVVRAGREIIPAEHRQIGMVFQDYALFPHMTTRDNIAFGLHAWTRHDATNRVDALLHLTGLTPLAHRLPPHLSGGQQQRVALARALAPRPSLLLLDEPFANLDAALRRDLAEGILDILRNEAVSALLVTHDHGEALGMADRVAVLGGHGPASGKLLQLAPPMTVYQQPANAQVAHLTGPAIILNGHAQGDDAQTPLGPIPLGRRATGPVAVLLRPEQLRFDPHPDGSSKIISRRFQGARDHVRLHTPAGELPMDCPGATAPPPGARGVISVAGPGWPLDP